MVDDIFDNSRPRSRVEIRTGVGRRRRWTEEQKGRIVAERLAHQRRQPIRPRRRSTGVAIKTRRHGSVGRAIGNRQLRRRAIEPRAARTRRYGDERGREALGRGPEAGQLRDGRQLHPD